MEISTTPLVQNQQLIKDNGGAKVEFQFIET